MDEHHLPLREQPAGLDKGKMCWDSHSELQDDYKPKSPTLRERVPAPREVMAGGLRPTEESLSRSQEAEV